MGSVGVCVGESLVGVCVGVRRCTRVGIDDIHVR